MLREDHINYLVHWVSGDNYNIAFKALLEIINIREIIESNINIKGSHTCICFTETPGKHFNFNNTRYKPFGICLSKIFVFNHGERRVIYEPDNEYKNLPEKLQWRHVRYQPCSSPPIDFTWKIEWRIKTDSLRLPHEETSIIVPDENWKKSMIEEFDRREWSRYQNERVGYREDLARPPEEINYAIYLKSNL